MDPDALGRLLAVVVVLLALVALATLFATRADPPPREVNPRYDATTYGGAG